MKSFKLAILFLFLTAGAVNAQPVVSEQSTYSAKQTTQKNSGSHADKHGKKHGKKKGKKHKKAHHAKHKSK